VTTEEWIRAGKVGKVREVHVWTDRPVWPQGLARRLSSCRALQPRLGHLAGAGGGAPVPPVYHPFNFRGWYDFGTGGLGTWPAMLPRVVKALSLGAPTSVSACTTVVREMLKATRSPTRTGLVRARRLPETFRTRPSSLGLSGPRQPAAVRMHWYEGGMKPRARPKWRPTAIGRRRDAVYRRQRNAA